MVTVVDDRSLRTAGRARVHLRLAVSVMRMIEGLRIPRRARGSATGLILVMATKAVGVMYVIEAQTRGRCESQIGREQRRRKSLDK